MDPTLVRALPHFVKVLDLTPHDPGAKEGTSGRFLLCTPKEEAIAEFLEQKTKPIEKYLQHAINTVHIGITGAGKSTLIRALQAEGSATAVPNHSRFPAEEQDKCHNTRIGVSMDTNGLGDPEHHNSEHNRKNLETLLDSNIGDVHGIFSHVKVTNRSDDVFVSTIDQALMLADTEARNNIVALSFVKPDYRVIVDTFKAQAKLRGLILRDVIIINLTFISIKPKQENTAQFSSFPSADESCFDYQTQRDAFTLFMIALMRNNYESPVPVIRRNQFCKRHCGNEGLDSRCFTHRCHGTLEAAHPPNSAVPAKECKLEHTGTLESLVHWDSVNDKFGEFNAGPSSAIRSALSGTTSDVSKIATTVTGLAATGTGKVVGAQSGTASIAELVAETSKKGAVWGATDPAGVFHPLESFSNTRFTLPPGKTLADCVASGSCPIPSASIASKAVHAGGAALKIAGNTLLVFQVVELGGYVAGIGAWSCCGAMRSGSISGTSPGCMQKWSCCGAWQATDKKAPVGCRRMVCKFCKGDHDKPPRSGVQELRCSSEHCQRQEGEGYVGKEYGGVKITRPCRELSGGDRKSVV